MFVIVLNNHNLQFSIPQHNSVPHKLELRMECIQHLDLNDFVFENVVKSLKKSEKSKTVFSASNYCDENQAAIVTNFFDANNVDICEEIFYIIVNIIGYSKEILDHLTRVFKLSTEIHDDLLKRARNRQPPKFMLRVTVIEANALFAKDSNGFSDPFVTINLMSNLDQYFKTSIKMKTLNPEWNESFLITLADRFHKDVLEVHVWDYDAPESRGEKVSKIFDIKSPLKLRKYIKEVVGPTGTDASNLIGSVEISLNKIHASGVVSWFPLTKANRPNDRGYIKLAFNFVAKKELAVAKREHQQLVKHLLLHDMEESKCLQHNFDGHFSSGVQYLLTQHATQSSLSETESAFIHWSVFAEVHADYRLSSAAFEGLLSKIIEPIQTGAVSEENLKLFWQSVFKILLTGLGWIYHIREKTNSNKINILSKHLSFMSKVSVLKPPFETEWFPTDLYDQLMEGTGCNIWNLKQAVIVSIQRGTERWFDLNSGCDTDTASSDKLRLKELVSLTKLLQKDFNEALNYYNYTFQSSFQLNYAFLLIIVYGKKAEEVIKPFVIKYCEQQVNQKVSESLPDEDLIVELYIALKSLVAQCSSLQKYTANFKLNEYYTWFASGVDYWLDVLSYKTIIRTTKAIELDNLRNIDENLKCSSSAVDTIDIMHHFNLFWKKLEWPDENSAIVCTLKMVKDICKFFEFYIEKLTSKANCWTVLENTDLESDQTCTHEWCISINDIDHVRRGSLTLIDDLISDLHKTKMPEPQKTEFIETIKATKNVSLDPNANKFVDFIDYVAKKMSSNIQVYLTVGAIDDNFRDRLMIYLDNVLAIINSQLNESNFNRVLNAIWLEICKILNNFSEIGFTESKSFSFFANVLKAVNLMKEHFQSPSRNYYDAYTYGESLNKAERKLYLFSLTSAELIHLHFKEKFADQRTMKKPSEYGALTVQCCFNGSDLHINIMNAKKLLPMRSNGTTDAYVTVSLLPEERFPDIKKQKTKCKTGTLYPIFDETFVVRLSIEQRKFPGSMVMFRLKHKKKFCIETNRAFAICLLSLEEILESSENVCNSPQISLPLSKPIDKNSDCIQALKTRPVDNILSTIFFKQFVM